MTLPIDPSMFTGGSEWQISGVGSTPQTPAEIEAGAGGGATEGASFGAVLSKLQAGQDAAAHASQALATGQASDPTAVVMAVEKAQLQMQLASTLRNKAVESVQEIFRTTV